jgi:hypothetical protein
MNMIGHFVAGPIWVCVKVYDCCEQFFAGTLIHVNSLEYVCGARFFTTDCA